MDLKILLVDDEPKVLSGLCRTLGNRFTLACANSGAEALAIVQSEGPFAAIVSDMRMPGMSGLDLLREMRQRVPETVRLVLSGHADFDAVVAAVNEGAIFRFHTKPVAPDVLADSLQCALLRHIEAKQARGRLDPSLEHVREVDALHRALAENQLRLYLQPQCRPAADIIGADVIGAEALVRWQHPARGLLAPGQFLPAVEAAGLMGHLTRWMLEAACAEVRRWKAGDLPPMRVAVNACPADFCEASFANDVADIIRRHAIPYEAVEIEITEGAAMADAGATRQVIDSLARLGVATSIDDFGSGYSSLGWLRQLSVQTLKIDRMFFDDITSDPSAYRVLQTIVSLGHDLGLRVLAEGVETMDQMEFVSRAGCDLVQGFVIAPPMPPEDFRDWVATGHRWAGRDGL